MSARPHDLSDHDLIRVAYAVDRHLDLEVGSTTPASLTVLAYAPVPHVGWGFDSGAALVRLADGGLLGVVLDAFAARGSVSAWLRERLAEYALALPRIEALAAALEREGL